LPTSFACCWRCELGFALLLYEEEVAEIVVGVG
jgi:hypothetical protein